RMAAVGRRSGVCGKAASVELDAIGPAPEFRDRVGAVRPLRLVREQQLEHDPARCLRALGCGLHLHAGRGLADAACREHALALDLDHASAAIAVGAIARLGQMAQMRDLGAEPARDLPDRLLAIGRHFAAVEREPDARGLALSHAALAAALLVVPVAERFLRELVARSVALAHALISGAAGGKAARSCSRSAPSI